MREGHTLKLIQYEQKDSAEAPTRDAREILVVGAGGGLVNTTSISLVSGIASGTKKLRLGVSA